MTTAAATSMTSLRDLLRQDASRDMIRTYLDGLDPRARVDEALSLGGRDVAKLSRAVAGGMATTITDFVPKGSSPDTTIIFEGKNSLPVFTRFQKRFATLSSGQTIGYNHGSTAVATGPGYFVVRAADDAADVPGQAYFDYTGTPEGVPVGWPPYKPNDVGLSNLVYKNMKDYMRQVARGVYVGEAYKLGKPQKAWFILARPLD
jgi:hypothetical protein